MRACLVGMVRSVGRRNSLLEKERKEKESENVRGVRDYAADRWGVGQSRQSRRRPARREECGVCRFKLISPKI